MILKIILKKLLIHYTSLFPAGIGFFAAVIFLLLGTSPAAIVITEIHYHPATQDTTDGDFFEFIELKNTDSVSADLSGYAFTNGITYTFPAGSFIAPKEFVVLARDSNYFHQRYGSYPQGTYTGKLNNNGELVVLMDPLLNFIDSLHYGDDSPWPVQADGMGPSLVAVTPDRAGNPSDPASWRPSSQLHGSPGTDDPAPAIPPVLVNEVLSHTDLPQVDVIELFNPSAHVVDVSNWYITDNPSNPKKFKIPAGTKISAKGYRTFTESDFNADSTLPTSFAFSSHGDEGYIFSADADGKLTGYVHGFKFGEIINGASFGRYVNSAGVEQFVAQQSLTLGAANAGPRVGEVVITEIMYHHPQGHDYLEIKNTSAETVPLFDPENPLNGWKVGGIGFIFPAGVSLAPGEIALLADDTIAVEEFRSAYRLGPDIKIFGFTGRLNNGGESISIARAAPPFGEDSLLVIPYEIIDEVHYGDGGRWPLSADGAGNSLHRGNDKAYGDDPGNWYAGPPSLGSFAFIGEPPFNDRNRPVIEIHVKDSRYYAQFDLPNPGLVDLELFNVAGRNIKNIYHGFLPVETHAIDFTMEPINRGFYFISFFFNNKPVSTVRFLHNR